MAVFDYAPGIEPEELRRLFALTFASTTHGIAIIEPRTRNVVAVNPAYARMHAGTAADFTGKPIDDSLTPEAAARLPGLAEQLETFGFLATESDHVRRDGTVFHVGVEVMAARDDAGELMYRICWFTDLTERDRLERERREAQGLFEAAFRYAAVGMAIVDLEGRAIRANAALCRLLGYSEEQLRGMRFAEFTHPDDLAATFEGDERLLRGEAPDYQLEKRYIRADGGTMWALISVSLDRHADGDPDHYIVHVQDVTLRRRMQEDLSGAAAADRLDRDLVCAVTAEGLLARLGGPWQEVLGHGEKGLSSRPLADLVHPDDRAAALGELARVRETGAPGRFRCRLRTEVGGWAWLQWSLPGMGADREVLCSIREAGERIEIEHGYDLRGEVIANMAEGVCLVTSDDMRIVYANPALERMLGYEPEELNGRDAREVMRPPDLDRKEAAARDEAEARLRRTGSATYEGRRLRKDGTQIWCRTATTTFNHPRYGAVWVAVQQDVTEERRAAEAAAALERAKIEFLGSVSHELRTPLTSILGYAALVRADAGGPAEPLLRHVEVIERNAARQLRLVEDLLNVAQIEAGEFDFRKRPIDLGEVVAEAAENVRPDAEAAELTLVVATGGPLAVMGDPDRLAQVISNLLTNAVKFTPAGGRIEVDLRAVDAQARLTVEDSGPGIDESERPRLFERLYRGEEGRERQIAGAGLGLAISRAIVEAHSGRIEVRAGHLGGACFEVTLPVLSRLPRR
ncbi:MAG: PAS domain S-box protein [Syntrophothermus sp.]